MKQHKRNVSGILKFAKEKNKMTIAHIERTLNQMIKKNQEITFSGVAESANVSRSCLYKNSKIRKKIETMRQQQNKKSSSSTDVKSQKKPNKIVGKLEEKIKKLERENKKLHKQLDAVYGKMVE